MNLVEFALLSCLQQTTAITQGSLPLDATRSAANLHGERCLTQQSATTTGSPSNSGAKIYSRNAPTQANSLFEEATHTSQPRDPAADLPYGNLESDKNADDLARSALGIASTLRANSRTTQRQYAAAANQAGATQNRYQGTSPHGQAGNRLPSSPRVCPTDLSYLNSTIPQYPVDPDITEMRNRTLSENIPLALARAHAQGLTTAQAAKQLFDQVEILKREEDGVKQSAQSLYPGSSAEFEADMSSLLNGSKHSSTPFRPEWAAYFIAHYAVVANKAIAAAFACLARREPAP